MLLSTKDIFKKLALVLITLLGLFLIVASGGSSSSSSGGGDSGNDGDNTPTSPPVVKIESPTDGTSYSIGDSVTFIGYAADSEENQLTGINLVWNSSKNGSLTTGNDFSTKSLLPGDHIITLTATDSKNQIGSAVVSIKVENLPNNPPVVTIIKPEDKEEANAGDFVFFEGKAIDDEDGEIISNNLQWWSNIDGNIGSGTTIKRNDLSGGTHKIYLIAKDMNNAEASSSVTLSIKNNPPTAKITFPEDGATYSVGDTITFNGEGSDAEDGDLYGNNLVWRSSLHGQFDVGRDISISYLPAGTHKITLTAKDKNGAVDTDQITITIN